MDIFNGTIFFASDKIVLHEYILIYLCTCAYGLFIQVELPIFCNTNTVARFIFFQPKLTEILLKESKTQTSQTVT